jgi:hypothetical protein
MTKDELTRLIEGPLAAYLGADCSYGRFVELLNQEFPELDIRYGDLYPRLFNLSIETADEDHTLNDPLMSWDIWSVGFEYLNFSERPSLEIIHDPLQTPGLPELVDVPGWETGINRYVKQDGGPSSA